MPSIPYTPNAYWWLQMHLLGGPVRLISFSVIYTTLLAGAVIGGRYLFRGVPITNYCDQALIVLTVIQVLLIILGGGNAVFRALTRDMNTRMLESHRMTPSSSAAVILGYMVGANLQILMMYAVGIVAGAVLIRWGTVGTAHWLAGNVYMLIVAPMVWAVTVMLGIGRAKPVNPNTILFIMLLLSMGLISIPGLGLLTGIYAGYAGVLLMTGQVVVPPPYAAVLALVCLGMTVIWTRAAMRKLRRPDLPAFGTIRALGLFIIWLIAGAGALLLFAKIPAFQDVIAMGPGSDPYFLATCVTVNGIASLVFAILPISAAAHGRCRLQRRTGGHKSRLFQRHTGVPVLCAALVSAFSVPFVRQASWDSMVWMFVALWASFVTLEGLLISRHARNRRALLLLVIYMIVFWGVPPMADLWYGELVASRSFYQTAPPCSVLFGFSPAGTVAKLFFPAELDFDARYGVAFQIMVAAITGLLGLRALQRLRARDS
ncbi:MAG: hypothetical protein V3W34_09130 [Phycisphaerae bacterium]